MSSQYKADPVDSLTKFYVIKMKQFHSRSYPPLWNPSLGDPLLWNPSLGDNSMESLPRG